MKKILLAAAAVAGLAGQAYASPIVLTFEGVGNAAQIGNFYNGGAGGNYGISFGSDSLGLIASSAGGSGNFSNNPSGSTVAFFTSGAGDLMNVSGGFDTGFSFYYAASQAGSVSVYDGLNGTGTLLATLTLVPTASPYSVWASTGVTFAGTAKSVLFGGAANYIAFDDVTVGSEVAGAVPEPAMLGLFGMGAVALGLSRRRKAA